MSAPLVAFIVLSINPFGGLTISIPLAILKFHFAFWWVLLLGIPLAYVQVLAVDLLWNLLAKLPWWFRFLEKRRSPRVEKLVASRGSFWLTMIFAPIIGPWLVMAFMRYAHVPQRKIALPILLGLTWNASAITACSVFLPYLFKVKGA